VQENLTTKLLTEKDDKEEFYQYLGAISGRIGIDDEGFVYNKDDADYPAGRIVYDAENCTTLIRGGSDNDGYAIDIVGNR
jgi:poly-gamma-glutamate synthesis protein (capsule biosynthesis protein)